MIYSKPFNDSMKIRGARGKEQTMDLEKELVALTSELIRIPSTHSRPDEIRHCADFIEGWLARHDIAFQRYDIGGVPAITVCPNHRPPGFW